MTPHKFAIGDRVVFQHGRYDSHVPHGTYTVARLLPSEDGDNQYRVKNSRDNHERMVRESQLRPG